MVYSTGPRSYLPRLKGLPGKDTLTYLASSSATEKESFITLTSVRPPRRKKATRGSGDGSVTSSILQRRRSTRSSVRSNRSNRSNARKRAAAGGGGNSISFVPDQPFRRSNTRLGFSFDLNKNFFFLCRLTK